MYGMPADGCHSFFLELSQHARHLSYSICASLLFYVNGSVLQSELLLLNMPRICMDMINLNGCERN